MAFIQPCYIKLNNNDIISRLDEIGYYNGWTQLLKCNAIITDIDINNKGFYDGITDDFDYNPNHYYDCGTNIELFFALSALRDNNDLHQWVICQQDYIDPDNNINYKKGDWRLSHRKKMKKYKRQEVWRKATLEELIEKFS